MLAAIAATCASVWVRAFLAYDGLRPSNDDKRRAVERMLRDDEWCRWSDGKIGADQPIDRPPLDLVGRPRSLISVADSRAGARPRGGRGSVGAFTRRPTRSKPRSASRH
jgi:hypothetical protein